MKSIFVLLSIFGALSANASAISEKYKQLGGADSFLGAPTTPEATTPDGAGSFRHYQQGSIYFHPATGAHEVHGLIRQKWAALGWELSPLGYPMTDEIDLFDGSGKVSKFQGGEILWKSKTNAVSVVQGTDLRIDVPFPAGTVWHVIAANNDHHVDAWAYCWDFNLHTGATVGAPFASVADAPVMFVDEKWNGEGPDSVVVQRLGEGKYVSYLHLAQGAYTKHTASGGGIALPPQQTGGKSFANGATLGVIGVLDHLHFCITTQPDRPEFLPFESVPFVFRNYSVSNDEGKSWTSVPVGLPAVGQWIRRDPPKSGSTPKAQVKSSSAVISRGTVKVRVLAGDGKPTGKGHLTVRLVAPWNEVLKTKVHEIPASALNGPWDITFTNVPAYKGLKARVEYKGPWNPAADFVRGDGAALDLKPDETKMTTVTLKTTLIH